MVAKCICPSRCDLRPLIWSSTCQEGCASIVLHTWRCSREGLWNRSSLLPSRCDLPTNAHGEMVLLLHPDLPPEGAVTAQTEHVRVQQ